MRLPLLSTLLIAGMVLGGAVAPRAAAETGAVQSWITVSSTRPAADCGIDLSVELRGGGDPIGAAAVSVSLFSGSDVVGSDAGGTDDSGIARLHLEPTSGADWIDVNVGGSYLTGLSVATGAGDSCSDGAGTFTASGDMTIAAPATSPEAGSATGHAKPAVGVGVPFLVQQRNLSCEYAAVAIATAAWGNGVSEYSLDDVVGHSANPHQGYRGDITGWWGNTVDYGVYAEPLAAALPQFGFNGDVFYAQGDSSQLTGRLDAGIPTIVWISMWGDQSVVESTGDSSYTLVAGEHVVVAYGYDAGGVYVSDPAHGDSRYFSWDTFMWMWNVLDGMSLAVTPA